MLDTVTVYDAKIVNTVIKGDSQPITPAETSLCV